MPRYQYQGTPLQPPAPTVSTNSGSVTSAKAGTKSVWLQYRNRAGYSLVSTRVDVTVAANQRIDVTVPLAALPSPNGAYIWEYTILLSNDTNVNNACVVATIPGYDSDETTALSPPFTVQLSRDEHLELSKTVTLEADLPTGSDRIHGMRRYVDELGQIVEWDSIIEEWTQVVPGVFNTYVSSVSGNMGAGQDISAIADLGIVIVPDYGLSGTSIPVGFWLVNDGGQAIAQGTRIGLTIENGDEDVSYVGGIVGGVQITFRGYVNTTTGVLDTTDAAGTGTMTGVNLTVPYQGKQTGLTLPKALPAGSAYWMDVQASITPAMLNNRITQGSTLKFSPYFYTDFAVWNPAGKIFGDFVAAEHGLRRILPNVGLTAIAQAGSGNITVANGAFTFDNVAAQDVVGFTPNTSDQEVWLSINGTCLLASTQPDGTRQRALVGTVDGTGDATAWNVSTVSLDGGTLLEVDVTYPTTIRDDYGDRIAGTSAIFNATYVTIYVRPSGGGDILKFDELVLVGEASQSFTVGSVAGTNIGTTLPTAPSADFGLFEPADDSFTVGTAVGDSEFAADTYEVAIAYRYLNTITAISHDPIDGNIYEASGTLAQVFQRTAYWAEAVDTIDDLRAVPLAEISNLQTRMVKENGRLYVFRNDNSTIDDGTDIIRPTAIDILDPGRFVAYNKMLQLGTVETGWEGSGEATLTDVGGVPTRDLVLPRGERWLPGPANQIEIGTVATGWEGQATATITGSAPRQTLNLVLPRGEKGLPGPAGAQGPQGPEGNPADYSALAKANLFYG